MYIYKGTPKRSKPLKLEKYKFYRKAIKVQIKVGRFKTIYLLILSVLEWHR